MLRFNMPEVFRMENSGESYSRLGLMIRNQGWKSPKNTCRVNLFLLRPHGFLLKPNLDWDLEVAKPRR